MPHQVIMINTPDLTKTIRGFVEKMWPGFKNNLKTSYIGLGIQHFYKTLRVKENWSFICL